MPTPVAIACTVVLLLGFPALTFVAGLRRGRQASSEPAYRLGYQHGWSAREQQGEALDAAQAAPWPPPE